MQVSTDGGTTWVSLANPNTTSEADPAAHPNATANLPGFTGSSGGWVQESFDLSAYTGQNVFLRFLYVTVSRIAFLSCSSSAVLGCGWLTRLKPHFSRSIPQ